MIVGILQDLNELNRCLYEYIEADRRFHLTVSIVEDVYFLRLSTGSINNNQQVSDQLVDVIKEMSDKVLRESSDKVLRENLKFTF